MESFTDPDQTLESSAETQMKSSNVCILHIEKPKQKSKWGNILSFSDKHWKAVLLAAESRRKKCNFVESVYHNIVQKLPSSPDENEGYHVMCYKNFTAIPSETASTDKAPHTHKLGSTAESPHLRSATPESDRSLSSTSGIFPPQCIFCGNARKRKKGQYEVAGSCETIEAGQSIHEAASALNDSKLLSKISGIDLVAKEAKYHHSCKSAYLMSAKRVSSQSELDSNESSKLTMIQNIHNYVEKAIICNKRPELLTSVYARYTDMCTLSETTPINSAQSLMRNLINKFGKKLRFHTETKKLGIIIYNSDTADKSVRVAYDYASDDEHIVTKAAFLLRKNIFGIQKKDLPENPTLDDLKEGDAFPPKLLSTFFTALYSGAEQTKCSEQVKRRVKSSCDDALFIVKRGKVKPAKQVALGMAVKTVTGSKKLVQVLNRFGHSLNYNCLEELETNTAEKIQERMLACPIGTVKHIPMGLAFDNFDEMTQTLSGANTLHDTMGILYQNISDEQETNETNVTEGHSCVTNKQQKGRKRSLAPQMSALEPYRKKPKMTEFNYNVTDISSLPDVSAVAWNMDFLWVLKHALKENYIPMWVGYNAASYSDNLPKQAVLYMPNLQQPITRLDVIQETLLITQRCTNECEQKFGIVTYDLNAAKPAMQIQATEKPRFDDIFIMLGAFHVEMAFFKAVGKLLSNSGGPDMLTNTDVLAPGSLNGFLSGKHFNRCKRLHPILALAFEILHFREFMKDYSNREQLTELTNEPSHEEAINSATFSHACTAYKQFADLTRSGAHGFTAQFWLMYIDYIRSYHNLERSIRTNNISLYIYSLTPIIGLFFATNHINYARWLTKFQLDLANIDNSHPGLRSILEKGAFSIRRTDNAFSRIPVDLTLEQTVNADAASRLSGITSATNNYGARLRWMITRSTRASFVSIVHEMAGLLSKDDIASEIKPARIHRDNRDLTAVIKHIEDTHNPFDRVIDTSTKLFNINTGKAVSTVVKESLLNIPQCGQSRHQEFVQSCVKDPSRFEQRIKKTPIKTFAYDCASNKSTKDKRIAELKCSRDLMGRLVLLATKRNLDLPYIFSYPLTPVPLSLCNADGTMTKTPKSSLLGVLESKVKDGNINPQYPCAYIIDGQFLLHTLPPYIPPNYGGLARSVLIQALSANTQTKEVHLLFDDYPQPSLKDFERGRRGVEEREYLITGPEQVRPKHINDALKSRSFKSQLPQFLAKEWQDQTYADIFRDKKVFLDVPGECYLFRVFDGVVTREDVAALRSNHEEADTKICLHAKFIESIGLRGDIVIRASDTDIAVIMLYHCNKFASKLWMDVGISAKNSRRYICLSSIHQILGLQLCLSLPAFHAFTGCDYTSSFVRKGKVQPFAKLLKNIEAQKAFNEITCEGSLSGDAQTTLQTFTAQVYGAKNSYKGTLNEFRYSIFERGYSPSATSKNPLEKLKGINASVIPPCEAELNCHIKRVSFIAKMWADADQTTIQQHPIISNGWDFQSGLYQPIWHEGAQLPDSLIPENKDIDSDSDDDDEEDDMTVSSDDESASENEDDQQ